MVYGYDLLNVVLMLIMGYWIVVQYYVDYFDLEKQMFGVIYDCFVDYLEDGDYDVIFEVDCIFLQWWDVDMILEVLD